MSNNFDTSSTGINVELNLYTPNDTLYFYFNENAMLSKHENDLFISAPEHSLRCSGLVLDEDFRYGDLINADLYDFSNTNFEDILCDMVERDYIDDSVADLLSDLHKRKAFVDEHELRDLIIHYLEESGDDEAYELLESHAMAHYVFAFIHDNQERTKMYFSKEALAYYRDVMCSKITCNHELAQKIIDEFEHSFTHIMLGGDLIISNQTERFDFSVYDFYEKELSVCETEIDKEEFMKNFEELYNRYDKLHVFDKELLMEEVRKLVPSEIKQHWY